MRRTLARLSTRLSLAAPVPAPPRFYFAAPAGHALGSTPQISLAPRRRITTISSVPPSPPPPPSHSSPPSPPPFSPFSASPPASLGGRASAPRVPTPRERQVSARLCQVPHPDPSKQGQDIVSLGFVRSVQENDGIVSIALELDTNYRAIKKSIEASLASLVLPASAPTAAAPSPSSPSSPLSSPWIRSIRVSLAPATDAELAQFSSRPGAGAGTGGGRVSHVTPPGALGPRGVRHVRNIIAVSSCKGGVGKSTVAVNLAYALASLDPATLSPAFLASRGAASTSSATSSAPASSSSAGLPLRVGILDADIYGPSLPTMVSPASTLLREAKVDGDSLIEPLVYEGVKLMSYGYVPPSRVISSSSSSSPSPSPFSSSSSDASVSHAAAMRGPMVAQLVGELATRTHWGELDFLVIDMPPGTGDIHLTLTQQLRLTGAVIVTSPQRLSFVDVVKGLDLFDQTRVPVLGVVQNLAYYVPPGTQEKHFIFGNSERFVDKLRADWGVTDFFQIPIVPQVACDSDRGDPFVLGHAPEMAETRALYGGLARFVADACAPAAKAARATQQYVARFNGDTRLVELTTAAPPTDRDAATPHTATGVAAAAAAAAAADAVLAVPARDLRLACRCAGCVHEFTGKPLLRPERVPKDVRPLTMVPRGQYALSITWSDGHQSSLYPWTQLLELAKPLPASTSSAA